MTAAASEEYSLAGAKRDGRPGYPMLLTRRETVSTVVASLWAGDHALGAYILTGGGPLLHTEKKATLQESRQLTITTVITEGQKSSV